jgi:TrkA domain protein
MDVNETLLPGIGVRYEFKSQDGDLIGVVRRRNGDFEIVQYSPDDPDQARLLLHLTDDEADAFAQILGAPRIAAKFTELTRKLPGIESRQIRLPAGSPFVDRSLGETQARTRTGASIVAVVRGDNVIPSPTPAEELHQDDTLIVIGTHDGIVEVERLIEKG